VATFTTVYSLTEAICEKKHDFGADTVKALLTNTAPVRTNTVKADITGELSTGDGYTAGGNTCAVSTSAQTTGTYKLVLSDPATWTGSGAGFGPFRYVVLYNDTAASDELIGWYDYGSSITVLAGETFALDLSASNGLFTLVAAS
jgi:hypothetical protein